MNNALVLLIFNQTPAQLALTKRAVASVLAQDIPIDLFLIDNGSKDQTWVWLKALQLSRDNVFIEHHDTNISPVLLSNWWMEELYHRQHYPHILFAPNDVELPINFYSQLLRFPRGIVTASMTAQVPIPCESAVAVNTCTPMAVALVRRWAYDALIAKDGYFLDPFFWMYASDCDMALRIAACGIAGVQLDIQYHHTPSSSWRLAPPGYAQSAGKRADADRDYFFQKWGFKVDDPRYSQAAADINFKGEPI